MEKVDGLSLLGDRHYEVVDTKLKRKADPKHVLQLVLYSDMLTKLQGDEHENAHLMLGTGGRVTIKLTDVQAYARLARHRLVDFVAIPKEPRPEPASFRAIYK